MPIRHALLCLALTTLPAGAECLTGASLETGVVFSRADGRSGLVERRGTEVFIDYDTGPTPWTDERQGPWGIYETHVVQYFQDEDAVGGGPTDATRNFVGKLSEPLPDTGWTGKVRSDVWQTNSSEAGGFGYKVKYAASYAFLPEKTVKLSGCSYRAIPVEASFVAKDDSYTRRWLYFPDLGFGLETRFDGADNGLKSLKAR